MRRDTYRERWQERLRLLGVYEVLLRYGGDSMLEHGTLGAFRRAVQTWIYRPEAPLVPLSRPVKLRLLLEELGPTYVKFGQIVSSRAGSLPSEWEEELARLQSDVAPFPAAEAQAAITAELHAPPEELLERFDPVPLAAASLGQVHRAVLHDGRGVVVKVQRPGIEDKIRSDLRILAQAARTLERRAAWARDLALDQVIGEFGRTLLLELDYRVEAYNARRLARNLAAVEGVRVPEIVRPLSTEHVLTMEFVDGIPATHRDEIVAAGLDPVAVADAAIRATIKMMLIDGFYHADPHPGNVLVGLDDGVLTFVDAGMVGTLTLRQRIGLVNLLETAADRDPSALAGALLGLSEPVNGDGADPRAFERDFERLVGPFLDIDPGERLELATITSTAVDLLRDHGLRPDPQLSLALKAMTQAEQFTKVLYPPGSSQEFVAGATETARELVAEQLTVDRVKDFARAEALTAARTALRSAPGLDEIAGMWLRQLRAGKFQVKLDLSDLEPQVARVRNMVRLSVVAMLLVGVLVASAIASTAASLGVVTPLRQVAIVGYAVATAVAAFVVAVLGWRLLRGGPTGRRR